MSLSSAKLSVLITLALLTINPIMICDGIDDVVGGLISELNYLRGRGLDISNLTARLSEAVKAYYSGDVNLTLKLVGDVRSEVSMLKDVAEVTYLRLTIAKYVTIASLLSTPIITYFLLPTVYAYIWYYLRRRWVVR